MLKIFKSKNKKDFSNTPKTWDELLEQIYQKELLLEKYQNSNASSREINTIKKELEYLNSLKKKAEEELQNSKIDSYNYDGRSL